MLPHEMKRHPSLQKFVDSFTEKTFGRSHTEALEDSICVTCGDKVEGFKDELSKKEYSISGMCQKYQDDVFKK